MYDVYKKLVTGLNKILEVSGILMMLLMVFLIAYQVFMRFVLNNAPSWTEEFSIFLIGWFVYFGIVVAVKEDLHISIELLVSRLPKKIAFGIEVGVNFLLIGLAVIMTYWGINLATNLSGNRLPATGISVAFELMPLALAGTFMILVLIERIIEQFLQRREQSND